MAREMECKIPIAPIVLSSDQPTPHGPRRSKEASGTRRIHIWIDKDITASQNHISLDLIDDQITTARAGLDQWATALTGLVAIPDSERRNLIYMGPRSEVFVRQTLRVMAANPQIVSPSLDLAGESADLATLDRLRLRQQLGTRFKRGSREAVELALLPEMTPA